MSVIAEFGSPERNEPETSRALPKAVYKIKKVSIVLSQYVVTKYRCREFDTGEFTAGEEVCILPETSVTNIIEEERDLKPLEQLFLDKVEADAKGRKGMFDD